MLDRKAQKALRLWQDYVSKNHHKDRDFQITIYDSFSMYDYKSRNYVAIIKNPYVVDGPVVSHRIWKKEDLAIIDLILELFNKAEGWCTQVVENEKDYDVEQRNQAKFFFQIEKERKKLEEYLEEKHWDAGDYFYSSDYEEMLKA